MRLETLPRALLALVFIWTLPCIEAASSAQSSAGTSFLSDTLIREDHVQKVLEHEPKRVPSCEQSVWIGLHMKRRSTNYLISLRVPSR